MKKICLIMCLYLSSTVHGVIYHEPTAQFKPRIAIAALYIEYEGKILLLHRQESKSQGNRWGIPGGKVDKGETPQEAVLREAKEETGYDFINQPIENLGTVYIEYNEKDHFSYHMFRVKFVGDPAAVKINFHEHKGFTWVTPQDGLKLDLIQDEDACFKHTYG
ncbi:NUDIX hydrolase, partial [Chlamydiota bacterium]